MIPILYLLLAAFSAAALNRVPSRLLIKSGQSVTVDSSLPVQMDDVHKFLNFLSANQNTQKRTFGPIGTSLLNTRRYSVMILLDADMKSTELGIPSTFEIQPQTQQFMKFSPHVYEHAYTLASVNINSTVLSSFVSAVNGSQAGETLNIDGTQFSATVPSEARFLDDVRKIVTLPSEAKHLTTLRYASSIELTLISTINLPKEKQAAGRAILKRLTLQALEQLDKEDNYVLAIVFTDFSDRHTYHPYAFEHPDKKPLSLNAGIITARFNRPIRPESFYEKIRPSLRKALKRQNEEPEDDSTSKVQYVIGWPTPITGRPGFHFFFWSILLVFIAFIYVCVKMWNMKTFEDPLIYNTEYVPEPDSSVLGEDD